MMVASYLGDGVTVEFNGCALELWTERNGERQYVYLEPHTWRKLLSFVADKTTLRTDVDDAP